MCDTCTHIPVLLAWLVQWFPFLEYRVKCYAVAHNKRRLDDRRVENLRRAGL
jgi:hypothetical protein